MAIAVYWSTYSGSTTAPGNTNDYNSQNQERVLLNLLVFFSAHPTGLTLCHQGDTNCPNVLTMVVRDIPSCCYNLHSLQGLSGNQEWLGEDDQPLNGFNWTGGCEMVTTGILLWSKPYTATIPSTGEEVTMSCSVCCLSCYWTRRGECYTHTALLLDYTLSARLLSSCWTRRERLTSSPLWETMQQFLH